MSEKGFFDNLTGKQGMIFGLTIGVAAVSLVGFLVLMSKGGTSLGSGNQDAVAVVPTVPTPTAPTPQVPPEPSADISKVAPVTDADHIRGNKNAKVTLLEYSDFECPFCGRHLPTITQLLEQYGDDIRLVYRHFPLTSIHPNAQKAAEASECAAEQGKFWEFHDKLFANQTALAITNLKTYAKDLGLNQTQFDSCLDSSKYAAKVNQQASEAQAAGVTGTPGTFVNDELVRGAYPVSAFTQIIDPLLQ